MEKSPTTNGLPPLASSGVFAVSASIDIDAPRDVVWDVLMDWNVYREWNPFVRNQQITAPDGTPLKDQTPHVGAFLSIRPMHIPPTLDDARWFPPASAALERITVLDRANYRCAWRNIDMPAWALRAERWQALVELGDGRTRYETVEVFGGAAAYVIRVLLGGGLRAGFRAMAEGLKARAEERVRTRCVVCFDGAAWAS
ncbi:hypothetical protein BJ138DRAFT_1090830 [Hygrophoropsis aurantiaca]|uniref:Uncharacterized protein n=1 Tax=Hygrophoropsis aurantiaca TaxID=72124 RepID=A0ACB8A6H3_9AGAM|nr:hypothetical protein BJ138DRAFT_1090830 [Hygrophoropsis aurantiaca]